MAYEPPTGTLDAGHDAPPSPPPLRHAGARRGGTSSRRPAVAADRPRLVTRDADATGVWGDAGQFMPMPHGGSALEHLRPPFRGPALASPRHRPAAVSLPGGGPGATRAQRARRSPLLRQEAPQGRRCHFHRRRRPDPRRARHGSTVTGEGRSASASACSSLRSRSARQSPGPGLSESQASATCSVPTRSRICG